MNSPPNKTFPAPDFIVHDGDGNGVSKITNLKLTIVQGRKRGTTAWTVEFHVRNKTAGEEDRGNTALFIEFKTAEGGPAPIPGGRLAVFGWRDHCYFGDEGHQVRAGIIDLSYDDFVNLAHAIELHHSPVSGRQGKCNDSF